MFATLRRARADVATMNALLPAAERIARQDGIDRPGAEHLLLAALDLDDRIAAESFASFEIDPARLRAAIEEQHVEALDAIGVIADDNAISATLPAPDEPRGLYRSQGSLQTAFQAAVDLAKTHKSTVNSGHVLLAVSAAEHGTVARALDHLAVDKTLLRDRAQALVDRAAQESGR